MDNQEKIINLLLKDGNILSRKTFKDFLEIDSDFDFNRFNHKKIPVKILFFDETFKSWRSTWSNLDINDQEKTKPNLNRDNSRERTVNFPIVFKLKNDKKLYSDLNIFFRNISDVVYIEETIERIDWNTKSKMKNYYHVLYDDNKGNSKLKTFRFILHSKSKKVSNVVPGYFIKGYEFERDTFKKILRERKFDVILKQL